MIRFLSARERRLWTWVVAILAGILAAAVVAGSLVASLQSEALLGVGFAAGFVLAIAAVLWLAFRPRSSTDPWIALAVAAAVAMVPVRASVTAIERTHLFEYGLLAVVLYEALTERRQHGGRLQYPALAAIGIASIVGWLDEGIQALVPNRVYDPRDVWINGLAALVAVTIVGAIRWGRARAADRVQ